MIVDRRAALRGLALAGASPFFAYADIAGAQPAADVPILFVHGNGDDAAIWQTVFWRFESNLYPREKLFAFSFTNPTARDDDDTPQPDRSSTEDQLRELTAQVADVLKRTGAKQIALVGGSRGGLTIRNYVSRPEAARNVSHVVLCGAPNHGVFRWFIKLGNEFNGRGPFLKRLNATSGEIVPGPSFLTLRSDGMDKYAQPDGRFLGGVGLPTGVGADGPELVGALNLVLGALDHRETAFHPRAFREIFRFIAGREPQRIAILPEQTIRLEGLVTGLAGSVPTNRPLSGARVAMFAVSSETGERQGAPVWEGATDASGAWGPAAPAPGVPLEFEIAAPNYPITHIYRSGFPRSSSIVHLRPAAAQTDADKAAGAVVVVSRPRGFFGLPRDVVIVDGQEPKDLKAGVPSESTSILRRAALEERPIVCEFNEERIVCRAWPTRDNHVTIAEFTY
jgi:pimeloyl-ACP methyl ester carboxylesterase